MEEDGILKFVNDYYGVFDKVEKKTGLPKEYLMSQVGAETGWEIPKHNNTGGIKGKGVRLMTDEEVNGKKVRMKQNFTVYKTLEEGLLAHADLIKRRYPKAYEIAKNKGDISDYANEIVAGGWATDSKYHPLMVGTYKSLMKRLAPQQASRAIRVTAVPERAFLTPASSSLGLIGKPLYMADKGK